MKDQNLNDELVEIQNPKSYKKIKIAIAIFISLSIIITTTLLVGYFKFNWFQSEIYDIDIKISRNAHQILYFTDKKTIKTKIDFTNGVVEDNELNIITNFMVLQTERIKLGKNDFLNNATLIILDAKVNIKDEQKNITSFNIFDDNVVNEFKSNPNGTKYPMTIFSFYENGTIVDIKLPNNTDNYNTQIIIELIDNVIPKLSRNRTEDMKIGLYVNNKKDKNKSTLLERNSPREIDRFKGSKYEKLVERDIEDEYLTNVRTNANLSLNSQKNNEKANFGLKNFNIQQNSEITFKGSKNGNENFELIKNLVDYYNFIDSKDLIRYLTDKENTEKKESMLEPWKEREINNNSEIRKLGDKGSVEFIVKRLDFLGNDVDLKVVLGIANDDSFSAGLIISVDDLKFYFGTDGGYWSYSHYYGDWTLFRFQFPPMPVVGVALKAGGTISFKFSGKRNSDPIFTITLSGSLDAKAEVVAGWDKVASISAGAKGTLISATANGYFYDNGSINSDASCSGFGVSVYVEGKAFDHKIIDLEYKIWDGWTRNLNI